jgi:site-specific DNA-cytosine methylase
MGRLDVFALTPSKHVSVELDRAATRNAHAVYPDAHRVQDKEEVDAKLFKPLLEGVDARFISVIGGRPCQDVRGLNANDVGVSMERSSSFIQFVCIVKIVQMVTLSI